MYGQAIQLLDYQPDADPRTPGILVEIDGFTPTTKGLRTRPSYQRTTATLPDVCYGAYNATFGSGAQVVVAGTAEHLYRLQHGVWEVFDTGGVTHTKRPWSFAVFGNDLLAANSGVVQISQSGAPFRPLTEVSVGIPPRASIVETVNEGIFFIPPDGQTWWFSIAPTLWTPGVQYEVVSASLDATPGPITGFHRIRGGVVAYKKRSIYMGQFIGPPFYWSFQPISEAIGCMNQSGVVQGDDYHLFPAIDDFWSFDGASLSRIPNGLKEWFFNNSQEQILTAIVGYYDRTNSLALWYYPATVNGPITNVLIYNMRLGKWAKSIVYGEDGVPITVEAFVLPIYDTATVLTYGEFCDLYGTYDAIGALLYGDPSFTGTIVSTPALITADTHTLATRTGAPVGGSFTTGEIGDSRAYVQLSRVRPVFALYDPQVNDVTLANTIRAQTGGPTRPGAKARLRDGAFNFIDVARSHQLSLTFTGEVEITAMNVDVRAVGRE